MAKKKPALTQKEDKSAKLLAESKKHVCKCFDEEWPRIMEGYALALAEHEAQVDGKDKKFNYAIAAGVRLADTDGRTRPIAKVSHSVSYSTTSIGAGVDGHPELPGTEDA